MSVSRVIEVSFGGGSIAYAKVDTAYFYNSGIIFKPTDIDLPASYQVHWADSPQASTTLETIGTAEGAPIPDDLWDRSRVIYGWIYLHPTEDSGVTAYEVRIYKNVRAGLPDGTEPTPAEQSTIDQLISALNSAVEQTGQDAESASQSAQSASDDADRAESAKDYAEGYASNAQLSATQASNSASSAYQNAQASAQSASASAQIKADIEDMVDDAQSYAESALIASQASVTARDTAQGYAQSASASAQSASTSASNASASAQTASTKATEASTSAQTASQKATEASQSAENASQSAQTAESAKTASQTAQGLAESARDTAVSAKTDAESAKADAESARDEAQQAVASISGALAEKAPVITDTASGAIASFSDGADDLPLKSLVIDINPVQDLSHGDPSPENICPISGWTSVNVEQSGVNVWGGTFVNMAIAVLTSGSILRENASFRGLYARVKGGQTYTVSRTSIETNRFRIGATVDEPAPDVSVNELSNIMANDSKYSVTVTIPDGYNYIFVYLSNQSDTCTPNNYQVQIGSTATPYEPYTGRSITIALGQPVYGGKLDVLSGELVIDRAMVDLGTLSWTKKIDGVYSTADLVGLTTEPTNYSTVPNIMCSIYTSDSYLNLYSNAVDHTVTVIWSASNSHGQLWIRDMTYTDAETFKTAVTGQTLVYELATPLTIQLDAHAINSLYGVNNLWADSGDTEVEYRADTKLFIERLTAPDSADMVADANITSGKYFMVGNSLYKATANIANGAQIIVGTNCIRKSLSEALNEINA